MPDKKSRLILRQPMMMNVIYALVPLVIASVYFFGWRSLAVLIVVNLAGFLTEYVFCRVYRQPVSSACCALNSQVLIASATAKVREWSPA